MRVISGKYRGRRLEAFSADHIRPTTDRVKETLFNKLMGRVEGARVLDLFSGTGNLAIECLSREAAHVDLVEQHRKSLEIIKKNLHALGIASGYTIYPLDAFKYIRDYAGDPYDIVIADPPFTQAWAHELTETIARSRVLSADGWYVVEARRQERVDDAYEGLRRFDQRVFGDKTLNFFTQSSE